MVANMPNFNTAAERRSWLQAKWRKEHKSHIKVAYESKDPWEKHYRWIQIRTAPKGEYTKRGIKCRLTLAGIKRLWFRDKAWLFKQPSVDRIDNSKGYSFGNCRFMELIENIKKGGK
jgi:hypothetical protein